MIDSDPEVSRNAGSADAAPRGADEASDARTIAVEAADRERMAIDNDTGIARPRYNQYAVNDPESIDKLAQQRAREREIAEQGRQAPASDDG